MSTASVITLKERAELTRSINRLFGRALVGIRCPLEKHELFSLWNGMSSKSIMDNFIALQVEHGLDAFDSFTRSLVPERK